MASIHEIDPSGDVNLVLPRSNEVVSYLDGVLECPPTPPPLNFRRPNTQVPYLTKKDKKGRKRAPEQEPSAEIETYAYGESPAEHEPASATEALEIDVHPEISTNPEAEASAVPEEHSDTNILTQEDATSTPDETYMRIRASSKHLILASSYFERNLRSGMLESHTLNSHGRVEFHMDERDSEAMLIVMNILHGRTRRVPRSVDLDMLTRLAVLVDYLNCHEVIEPFSDRWIDELKGSVPVTYSKALIQWLCISSIFRKVCQFKAVTRTAIRQAKGPIQTLGLPISEAVVDEINQQRSNAINQLLSGLEGLLDDFRYDRKVCVFECNAMQYGALIKELGCRELLFPRPQIPFFGYSFENTVASVRQIQDPQWCSRSGGADSYSDPYCQPHTCRLTSLITPIIDNIDDNLKGLSLAGKPLEAPTTRS